LQLTPTNVSSRPQGQPMFPNPPRRTGAWTRAVETRVLPDRWIVLALREEAEVHRVVSAPVQEPLALTLAPDATPSEAIDISGDGLRLDPDIIWTVNFDRAEEVGMAVRMALDAQDLQRGFDRVLVLGVKSSLTPGPASAALEELIDGHHYSRGFAFL